MSTKIKIDNSHLVSLKEAAKKVPYSRDYLAKLAREKKIIATQVGRQWLIDLSSIQNFISEVTLEQEIRKNHLREERKRELLAKEKISSLNQEIQSKISNNQRHSLLFSSFVLCFGLLMGGVIYLLDPILVNLNSNIGATALTTVQENKKIETEIISNNTITQISTLAEDVEYPLFETKNEVREMSQNSEGIFLMPREGKLADEKQITKLFSDGVTVDFTGENSGFVRYETEDGEIREYPFVSVPKSKTTMENIDRPSS